ncbi:hypothetical protein [Proteus mirabilis]|uniref:phage tail fiber protein n=1 Tax=Proteus mirabilis TaxID=584 RepID=UPI0022B3BE7B|nr:hypothetical protein [Proteus mirabilis]MCZ4573068.1 hypothetical protein [Proteus mirabilis]MCZ4660414.1 hypothetical protein [Proteus mirabilis]MCZ4667918.1 hypothetical protein [Proteus mirabilis]
MYNAGTVTTTANSTKLVGVGTKWKDNNSLVSAEQVILIQNGATIYINSIASIQSNTEITLSFPVPESVSNAPYQILTTMVNSVSDAANKIVAMNVANVQFSDILNRWATESGTITVTLPDGTTQQLRTAKEMDKLLDGKFDKTEVVETTGSSTTKVMSQNGVTKALRSSELIQSADQIIKGTASDFNNARANAVFFGYTTATNSAGITGTGIDIAQVSGSYRLQLIGDYNGRKVAFRTKNGDKETWNSWLNFFHEGNTTKDSNGNLKVASPIIKVFADHIETNEESEGVEMEHLGVGHYLIKGVVGFNSDGAWGINNGFVIPQDHNGKNMVLIDYDVKPDGDIELFVFHRQNTDMPERFQNKRIKYIDKDGNPVYYENYEPCDVPESRWIDMRVEMPVNSIYNLKQAEAERLAKEEAERQAEEDAENTEIEAE